MAGVIKAEKTKICAIKRKLKFENNKNVYKIIKLY